MRRICALLIVLLSVILMSVQASAVGYDPLEFQIPVSTNEQMVIELKGADNQKLTKTINGKGSFSLTFTLPGTYTYTIRQVPGSDAKKIYDTSEYTVTVFVEDVNGKLTAAMSADKKGEKAKPSQISFENKTKTDGKGPKTGDDSHLTAWIAVMALAGFGLIAVVFVLLKKRRGRGERQ